MKVIFIPLEIDGYLFNAGSQRIRCEWVAPYLGADIYDRSQDLKSYDVIIYQKCYISPEVRGLADRYRHKCQIFDLCDPEHIFRPDTVRYMADRCKIITSSNEELSIGLMKFLRRPVYTVSDRMELSFFKVRKQHEPVRPKLVWFGYSANFHNVAPMLGEIDEIKCPLTIISEDSIGDGRFRRWKLSTVCDDIIEHDIVINPPGRFKSNNKTIMSWALGMPVATDIDELYKFLGCNTRRAEAELRLDEVKREWNVKTSAKELKYLINKYGGIK